MLWKHGISEPTLYAWKSKFGFRPAETADQAHFAGLLTSSRAKERFVMAQDSRPNPADHQEARAVLDDLDSDLLGISSPAPDRLPSQQLRWSLH